MTVTSLFHAVSCDSLLIAHNAGYIWTSRRFVRLEAFLPSERRTDSAVAQRTRTPDHAPKLAMPFDRSLVDSTFRAPLQPHPAPPVTRPVKCPPSSPQSPCSVGPGPRRAPRILAMAASGQPNPNLVMDPYAPTRPWNRARMHRRVVSTASCVGIWFARAAPLPPSVPRLGIVGLEGVRPRSLALDARGELTPSLPD